MSVSKVFHNAEESVVTELLQFNNTQLSLTRVWNIKTWYGTGLCTPGISRNLLEGSGEYYQHRIYWYMTTLLARCGETISTISTISSISPVAGNDFEIICTIFRTKWLSMWWETKILLPCPTGRLFINGFQQTIFHVTPVFDL